MNVSLILFTKHEECLNVYCKLYILLKCNDSFSEIRMIIKMQTSLKRLYFEKNIFLKFDKFTDQACY